MVDVDSQTMSLVPFRHSTKWWDAVAENSLNSGQNIEAAIRKGLLSLLFGLPGSGQRQTSG